LRPQRRIEGFALGAWQANCWVVGDRDRGTCVVVDPGQGGEEAVPARLEDLGLRCEAILLTHGHLDHLWAAPVLAERFDVEILLHREDRWLWDDPVSAIGLPRAAAAQLGFDWAPDDARLRLFDDGAVLPHGLRARHTPGHTPGSCVFLGEGALLSGDLLFAGSVGRTDLPGGSWEQQLDSLARVVLPLPDATPVHPGHGPSTTVGRERATNPYLADLGA
jgi:glyoxylase-like metal-dependent hydrolase (beta-lactamase superfamily II)